MAVNRRKQGDRGEDLAAEYLVKLGYRILERNYRFERGEIDIVAQEAEELVFVEVKARTSVAFGFPEESVTPQKEEQIINVAEGYLMEHEMDDVPCRFDVVAIEFINGIPDIRHIRDAF
ncbi:MAG: YraN family protein [Bacteroidota bacterium]